MELNPSTSPGTEVQMQIETLATAFVSVHRNAKETSPFIKRQCCIFGCKRKCETWNSTCQQCHCHNKQNYEHNLWNWYPSPHGRGTERSLETLSQAVSDICGRGEFEVGIGIIVGTWASANLPLSSIYSFEHPAASRARYQSSALETCIMVQFMQIKWIPDGYKYH